MTAISVTGVSSRNILNMEISRLYSLWSNSNIFTPSGCLLVVFMFLSQSILYGAKFE